MKTLAIAIGLLFSLALGARDLPSSISGDHVSGPFIFQAGYACRVIAEKSSAAPETHRSLEFLCTLPNNHQSTGKSTVLGCPSTSTLVPLTEWGSGGVTKSILVWFTKDGQQVISEGYGVTQKAGTLWIRIHSYAPGELEVRIGTFQDLINGGGMQAGFFRAALYFATNPYSGCDGPFDAGRKP